MIVHQALSTNSLHVWQGFPKASQYTTRFIGERASASQQFSTKATDWGKCHEPIALKSYVDHKISFGHTDLVAVKAGFVVCEEHPFLGASPDTCVHDVSAVEQFGLAEIKSPYKYCDHFSEDAALNSDFRCSLNTHTGAKKTRAKM